MSQQHNIRINDVLYYIHKDIAKPMEAKSLADIAAYSEQHFHRIFKQVVGESIHQYIRRTRMEYAANQLMFDPQSSVLEVANKSGFSSVSSFSQAFKATFAVSPGQWRKHEQQNTAKPYLKDPEIAAGYRRVALKPLPTPKIINAPDRLVAYMRHVGYSRTVKDVWRVLTNWARSEQRNPSIQFGLHHSNPALVELTQCRYVACIEIETPIKVRGVVNQLVIPGGLHALFRLNGTYGDLLPHISKILEQWLPESGFKLGSTPAYAHYHKNHFLNEDEQFELDFYLPISFH
ncbi:AraC family transcriptional regulator [Vibrio ostreicida]|uniref:AraC family transcriptional regulator n=1 Tax=Vibrio ostreicida TaxID=526588 RepID=UPI000970A966|nr:GyrI-like domain-containing protein [Vibrio ostreicida]